MSSYFRQVPNFEYVSVLPDAKIGEYLPLKNLFKKGKLREDIFQDLAFFEKYKIEGSDRPDNVAFKLYNDSTLDWVVLLSNNITNVQSEWPLTQEDFNRFLLDKYKNYETLYSIHHYETEEVKNSQGVVIIPAGLKVDKDYSLNFFDYFTEQQVIIREIAVPVTNYEYEEKIENEKRNIYVLKSSYLNVVLNDLKEIMPYKKGSSQYKTETLKTADNIRLYS